MNFNSTEEKVIYKLLSENNETNNKNLDSQGKENEYIREITKNISIMDQNRENYAFRNLPSHSKIKIFIKRVIRKLLKWYIEPICFQQTDFNNAVTPCIGKLTELQTINKKKFNNLENRNLSIEKKINDLNNQNEKIDKNLNEMNTKMSYLNNKIIEFDNIQNMLNEKILNISSKMDKLNSLDLKIFKENNELFVSQSGEDGIISYVIRMLKKPFDQCSYLDLGANHAKDLSNTYYLYQKGARGVLVEANPRLIPELKFYRHGDIILNRCIVDQNQENGIDFYLLNNDGLSSPDKDSVDEALKKNKDLKIENIVNIKTITISDILNKYFDQAPTVLNIDIEGKEMDILKTINFETYRPLIIIIEMIPYQLSLVIENKNQSILDFMIKNNYTEYAFTGINSIFLDKNQIK